ncbi:MAG: hypothetical protein Q8912_07705 [Bacillota bacterium]|nr:hypothetical protein [Bacillota bacterium]
MERELRRPISKELMKAGIRTPQFQSIIVTEPMNRSLNNDDDEVR